MSIKVVLAKAHGEQLSDPEIKKEFESVSAVYKDAELNYADGTVNFVFVKGIYLHHERKMITACLFVNKMDRAINELHGVIRLGFTNSEARIATTTINFNKEFMGCLQTDEGLLVHLGIPVKGLKNNEEFRAGDITGTFSDVRVTFEEEQKVEE